MLTPWPATGDCLPTVCQGRNRRENTAEAKTKYKLETGNREKLTHSHMAKKFSPNLLRPTQCLPQSSFLAIIFIITSQQTAIGWQKHARSRPLLTLWFLQSLQNTSLSPAKHSLCQNRGNFPLNRDFVPNRQTFHRIYKAWSSPLTYPERPEALYSLQLCCWHWHSCWQSWSFLLSRNVDICDEKKKKKSMNFSIN